MAKANLTNTDDVVIRPGVESDCEVIMELIKDLAVYEGMLNQVKLTTEGLHSEHIKQYLRFNFSIIR